MNIYKQIITLSKKKPKKILFDEIEDERILKAASIISKKKIAKVVLLGDKETILSYAKKYKIKLRFNEFLQTIVISNQLKESFAEEYFELKKHKGITLEQAKQALEDKMFYAAFLLKNNFVDGIVSGARNPTARTLKAAFSIIGKKEHIHKASSYFIIPDKKKIFFFADCAVNIEPNEEELSEIAVCTANSARSFNIEPKVAMLSFSTKGSAEHPLVDKVRSATKLAKQKDPTLIIDGELQLDAAIVPKVAKLKCPDSVIKGDANILIFPDLQSGNIGYKLVQRFANKTAIGPILQGLKKPVNDLSRGCTVEEIVYVTAITNIQAQKVEKELESETKENRIKEESDNN